jgi:hypothetical protein
VNKQTKKQTNEQTYQQRYDEAKAGLEAAEREAQKDPIKVGFYDFATDAMVAVELWDGSIGTARLASLHLANMYQSGRHRMPSRVWCIWNQKEYASIFFLDDKPREEAFLNHVLTLLV